MSYGIRTMSKVHIVHPMIFHTCVAGIKGGCPIIIGGLPKYGIKGLYVPKPGGNGVYPDVGPGGSTAGCPVAILPVVGP